ncbi:uncharacterized protein A1O5_08419 [Cladophialophora psammophila CBS 110553]|uniref:tRNA(His) guanylyltransferase n=1 Tax=Cladophialophora psammophila CBS 110553 TaxID=1182543 RepID=W9WUA5_9EURO|nr:uncharacterized protein A1O5_08419 [Cladophialophora psammophila CBS 110553]EXJ68625.1 hypothetical protein A1O5_08419 [Cladophialophora psammophila CBS 110553]
MPVIYFLQGPSTQPQKDPDCLTWLISDRWKRKRIPNGGRLSKHYDFTKPNDARALRLMNHAATHVVASMPEIILAYGVSDEYSFVFHRSATLFERRRDKIVSTVVSTFTAAYVLGWDLFFCPEREGVKEGAKRQEEGEDNGKEKEGEKGEEKEESARRAAAKKSRMLSMDMLPTFDGRAVCYPSWANLRDYLSWRQVDCHINNLYNTTFWALVQQGGMTHTAAEEFLKGTVSSDKNEILFSRFGINYNDEPDMYKKGSVVLREYVLRKGGGEKEEEEEEGDVRGTGEAKHEHERNVDDDDGSSAVPKPAVSKTQAEKMRKARKKAQVVTKHVDIIRDDFWTQRPWLRSGKPGETGE